MADFLRLNGLPVAVADSDSDTLERREFEEASRMFDGSISRRRIAAKRSWKFTTIPLPASDAAALVAMLQGRAEGWNFDRDAWSSRPLQPNTTANYFTQLRLSGPADGRTGYLDYNPNAYGKGIELGSVSVNRLAGNQRSVETDTTGFTAVDGATLLQSPDYFYHGTKSLRVLTSATVNGARGGVYTTGVQAGATGTVAGSCYVFATSAVSVRAYLYNATLGTSSAIKTIALAPYTWTRIAELTLTANATTDLVSLYILEESADSGIEFFVDALQIENLTYSTPFVDGSRSVMSRAEYVGFDPSPGLGITVSMWVASRVISAQRGIFELQGNVPGTTSVHYLAAYANGGSLVPILGGPTGAGSWGIANAFTTWIGQWLQFTYALVGPTGVPTLRVLIDGVQRLLVYPTANITADPRAFTRVQIGGYSTVAPFQCPIDDFVILPWVASDAHLANMRSATHSLALSPRLWAEGSFLPEGGGVLCDAQLADAVFASYAGVTNARRVSFSLEEV
jgi:hypothetical protein